MPTTSQIFASILAELFDHPDETIGSRARTVGGLVATFAPAATPALRKFADAMGALDLEQRQQLHATTFDLTPACTPYVSVHLFGEESFKRAELMVGLAESYARAGFDTEGELPDHLGVVLRFAPQFADEEWAELCEYCLPAALHAMSRQLHRSTNPYSNLVQATIELLAVDFPLLAKEPPCSTSSYSWRSLTSPFSSSSPAACGGCGQTPSATLPCRPSF